MKFYAFLILILISQPSLASITKTIASSVYLSGETSKRVMIVKPLSVQDFLIEYGNLGTYVQFKPNSNTGVFKLNKVPSQNQALFLIDRMISDLNLEYAYFEPTAKNATLEKNRIRTLKKHSINLSEETPDFESKQFYLEKSPKGVGARDAWKLKGGTGENVRVVDVEVCWQHDHEDFTPPYYIGANPNCDSPDHGTAVWGEVAAKRDGKGVTGIAHGSRFGVYGFIEGEWDEVNDQYISSINQAILGGTNHLSAGDVLIIEQHMVGPDQNKYVAVEYWPHIYEQLKEATDKGIICVAAAGNGDSNFDSSAYRGAFDLNQRDSGCIMVGAGDPNSLNRLYFSNYGSRIDAMGFGSNVTTTGYGDLFEASPTRVYTNRFSGTSSATPIVAGAVAVVSSIAKQAGMTLTPKQIREALRNSGSPQGNRTASQRIGALPNIAEMLRYLQIPTETF